MNTTVAPSIRQDAQVIGLVGSAHAVSHFYHLILASIFPWLKDAFNLSYAELGLLMTVFFVVSGFGQALAGFVVDRIGARRVLFFGLGCLGVAAVGLSMAQNYPMLLAGSMLAGLGNCVFHPADFTLLNKRVSLARLGHAFSTHGITGNFGWAAAPVFMIGIATVAGWRTALFCASFLAFGVLALLFVYRDVLATEPAHAVSAAAKTATHGDTGHSTGTLAFMRLPSVWMCFGFFLITAIALGGIQSFSPASLHQMYGFSMAWASMGITVYMLASAAGMVFGGFLASKTTRHDRTIALAFTVSGSFALLIGSGSVPPSLVMLLMAAVGFGAGIAGPSRDLLIRAAAPKNATGRVYGMVYSGLDTGSAVAPLLFGALMDSHHPAWVFLCIGLAQMMAIFTAVSVGSRTARAARAQTA